MIYPPTSKQINTFSCLYYQGNELFIEDCSLNALADKFGTPCYVYSKAQIEKNWHAFNQGFAGVAHRICYAVKANGNIALLKLLVDLGSGFDIVSLGELDRVLKAGGDAKKVVFSGVGKSAAEIERALALDVGCFDIESTAELERINAIASRLQKIAPIALRVNPDVEANTHTHIATGRKENKFGIDIEHVPALCQTIATMPAIKLIGIAAHIGSQITELTPFQKMLDKLLALFAELQTLNIQLQHINIGGGLGITYQHETPPSISAYADAVKDKLAGLPIDIILEPGRAIIANAGALLTRVEYLKHEAGKNFAIVDAGMNDFLRPALYSAWQNILPGTRKIDTMKVYDIAGPVCESADIFGKERTLCLETHDVLAIDAAGAYGFSMSSNYNARPRPAEVLVDGNQSKLIRRRETLEDMLRCESI